MYALNRPFPAERHYPISRSNTDVLLFYFSFKLIEFIQHLIDYSQFSLPANLNPLLCQLIKLPIHTFNITLIGKAIIAIIPDDKMLMGDQPHHFAGKDKLPRDGNIFR